MVRHLYYYRAKCYPHQQHAFCIFPLTLTYNTNLEATAPTPAESISAAPKEAPEPTAQSATEDSAPTEPTVPATDAEVVDSPAADTDTALASSASYALNLPSSEVDSEMAKRKARAERFGTGAAANGETGAAGTEGADSEAQKALDRAKRFGTGQTAMGKLDEALPQEPERGSRKRGRAEENSAMDDPGLRRGFSGRGRGRGGRFRGRGGRDTSRRRTGEKPSGVVKPGAAFSTEADRLAAEARRKKFATAS